MAQFCLIAAWKNQVIWISISNSAKRFNTTLSRHYWTSSRKRVGGLDSSSFSSSSSDDRQTRASVRIDFVFFLFPQICTKRLVSILNTNRRASTLSSMNRIWVCASHRVIHVVSTCRNWFGSIPCSTAASLHYYDHFESLPEFVLMPGVSSRWYMWLTFRSVISINQTLELFILWSFIWWSFTFCNNLISPFFRVFTNT